MNTNGYRYGSRFEAESAQTVEGFCVYNCYSTHEGNWFNQADGSWGEVIRDEADGLLHFVHCPGEA